MLGIALLHLLPHSALVLKSHTAPGTGALIGLIGMVFLLRFFHVHDHGVPEGENGDGDHLEACNHDHHHHHHHHGEGTAGISWTGLFFGLLLHTLFDGVALAGSVVVDSGHGSWMGLAGIGTFLAVALHKPLDAFAITSVMKKQNWSPRARNVVNFAFSLACPIGAFAFFFGATELADNSAFLGWGLAISAGLFIGIALGELLPEVDFQGPDRGKLVVALLLGVALAFGIENLPGHNHDTHEPDSHSEHEHHDHDHHHEH